jgi:hypothetical protein
MGVYQFSVAVFSKKASVENDQTYQIISFFNAEDLQLNGTDLSMIKDNEGHIWCFSYNYLSCFYPEKLNYNTAIPSLLIENIELNLRQTNWAKYCRFLNRDLSNTQPS